MRCVINWLVHVLRLFFWQMISYLFLSVYVISAAQWSTATTGNSVKMMKCHHNTKELFIDIT